MVSDLTQVFCRESIIVVATSSQGVGSVLSRVLDLNPKALVVCAAKGLSKDRGRVVFHHELFVSLGGDLHHFAYLSGPSFAQEVYDGAITRVTLACAKEALFDGFTDACEQNTNLSFSHTQDYIGVALCSVFKNVMAVLCGVVSVCVVSENTRAAFMVGCLRDITEVVKACGGAQDTVYGYAGLGDILLSATSVQSRNFKLGVLWYQQGDFPKIGQLCEGVSNVALLSQYLSVRGLESRLVKMCMDLLESPSHIKSLAPAWLQRFLSGSLEFADLVD